MPVVRVEHRTDEFRRVDQRIDLFHFVDGNEIEIEAEVPRAAALQSEIVHAFLVGGEVKATDAMDAAGLAGFALQLVVEPHGIGLQRRHVGVAVDRMHATRGMPGRAGGQFGPLDQRDVVPAQLGQVVEDADAHHAAADHRHAHMRFHGNPWRELEMPAGLCQSDRRAATIQMVGRCVRFPHVPACSAVAFTRSAALRQR